MIYIYTAIPATTRMGHPVGIVMSDLAKLRDNCTIGNGVVFFRNISINSIVFNKVESIVKNMGSVG